MARKKLVAALTIVLAAALAAGMAYAAVVGGPPEVISVDGAVYYADGAPAEKCTTVITELYSSAGELKYRDERCTGQGFPPVEQYQNKYKLSLAGKIGQDTVTVKALGLTNSSTAKEFTIIDIVGSRPGIVSDIGKAIKYIIGSIAPKEQPKPGEQQVPSAQETAAQPQPYVPDETVGMTFLALLAIGVGAAFVVLFKGGKRKKKGIASSRAMVVALAVAVIAGSLLFIGEASKTAPAVAAGGAPAASENVSGKATTIIVEGGFPTASAVEGEEGGGYVQLVTAINVNNNTHGFAWGPNGEKVYNTTWSNWSYVSDGTDANPCGNTCVPANGNCTLVNVSLVKTDTGVIQDSKKICTMQGYPNAAQFYYRFKTVVSTADGVPPSSYTVNVTATNYSFQGKNQTVCSGSLGCWVDVILSEAGSGVPPVWSINQSSIPSVYSPTNVSNFTLKWTDNGVVTTVYFESNFSGSPQNYTMIQLGNNFYNYNNTLPAGNFYWKSYAVDTTGDWAVSDTWYFTILQADNPTNLFFRNVTGEYMNQDMTITYPAQSNATATATAGATLNRNDTYTGGAMEVNVLGASVWAYKANATGNQNYSANFTGVTYYLYINQAVNTLNLYLNGNLNQDIIVNYGTTINSTGTGPDGVTVSRNDTIIPNGQVIKLAAARYAYKVNSTGNANYTVNATGATFIAYVNRVVALVNLNFIPSGSVAYGTQTTANCFITSGDPGATLVLWRNNTAVNTSTGGVSETNTLGAGVYNYTCVYQASQNYSGGYDTNYLTVTPAAAGVLAGTMHVLINGTESDRTFKYENVTNVTGYSTITGQDGLTFGLYRNAISAGSSGSEPYAVSDVKQLGAIAYTYIYNTTGNQNYSAASVTRTLTIEKKTPTLALSTAGTISYGAGAGASGSATVLPQADYTINLYVNSLGPTSTDSTYPYSVSDNTVYGVNVYTFTLNNSASANYTAASTTAGLTVNQVAPALTLAVMPSNSTMYPTTTTATGTVVAGDSGASTALFRNGTNVGTSTETIRLGAGPYNYTFAYQGSQNYSAYSITNITVIAQNTSNPLNLYINNGTLYINQDVSAVYGTSVTVQGLEMFTQSGTVNLYRDGQNTTNPTTITLGGGMYAFKANSTGNTNYTANATGVTYYLYVTQAANPVSLTLNGQQNNITVPYGTPITPVASGPDGVSLYKNDTTATSGQSLNLAAGTYAFKANSTGNTNYTANATGVTYYANVTQVTPTITVSFLPSNPVSYGTQSNATCAITTGDAGTTVTLYRNGTQVGTGSGSASDIKTLGGGIYNYTCVYQDSENYTAGYSYNNYFVVTPAAAGVLAGTMHVLINNTESDQAFNYETATNVTGYATITGQSGLTFNLYRNAVSAGSSSSEPYAVPDVKQLGVLVYTYIYNTTGNENYSAASATRTLTINKKIPTLSLSTAVNISYSTAAGVSGSATVLPQADFTINLYLIGGGLVSTNSTYPYVVSDNTFYGANFYTFSLNNTASANYTAASTTASLTVNQVAPMLALAVMPSNSVTYPTATNATGTVVWGDAGATTQLWRNTTNVGTSTETATLGVGSYNYTFVYLSSQNFSASSTYNITVIQQNATNPINLVINNGTAYTNKDVTISYGTSVTVTGSTVYQNAGTVQLVRDGQNASNPNTVILGGGVHAFKANTTGNTNYTANATGATYSVTVKQVTPTVSIGFAPSSSVTYGTSTTATCTITTGDAGTTLTLYRNGTQVGQGAGNANETNTLGAAVYNYTCVYQGSENYTTGYSYNNYLTVTQAAGGAVAGTMHVLINGAESDQAFDYETTTNVTGYATMTGQTLTFNLYSNAVSAGSSSTAPYSVSDTKQLGVLVYTYIYNTTGNENYSAASATRTLTINKKTPTFSLSTAGTISYGAGSGVSGSATVLPQADYTINLYVNGKGPISTDSTHPYAVSDNTVYGGGGYTFTLNNTASANYTAASTTAGLTVNPIASSVTVAISPSNSVAYGTQTTAACSITTGDAGATLALLRNGTQVNSSTGDVQETKTLAGGAYNYTCVYQVSQNYTTSYSYNNYLTVTPAGAGVLAGTMHLLINGTESDQAFDYETVTNATGYATMTGQTLTFNLYRNAVSMGSSSSQPYAISDAGLLGANVYTYIYNTTGNENYSAASATRTLTINKKTPTLSLSTAGTINYGNAAGVSGSATVLSQADYTINLYINDQGPIATDSTYPYSVSDNTVYGAGSYTFALNNSASANYLQASTSAGLTVNPIASSVSVTLSPSNSVSYGTQTTATCSINTGDPGATLRLLRNGTQVNSTTGSVSETIVLGAGVYNYTCVYQAGGNYTASYSYNNYLTVTQTAGSCALNINPATPITYGTATNASCGCTGTPNLYRNHSDANAENNANIVLPAGFWNYTCNSTASGNTTGASTSQGYQVNQASALLTLLLNGTDGDFQYLNATFARFTINTATPGLPVSLYTNYSDGINKLWDSGVSPLTNITNLTEFGVWNFTAYFDGNNNYTANSTTHYATVSEMRPNPIGNLTISLNRTSNDTMLNWTLSNSSDVYNYVIYVTDDYDAGFNFNNPYATASNSTTNWTDPTSDGVDERYYIVRVNNSLGLTDLSTFVVGKFNLKLYTGWNLISIPLLLIDASLDSTIYTADEGDMCERWTNVTFDRTDYFAGFGWFGDFNTLQSDRGYWYYSQKPGYDTVPFNVTLVGEVPNATRQQTITGQSWTMLGWTSIRTKSLDSALTAATDSDTIVLFEPPVDTFRRTDYFGGFGWFGDFANIEPGLGYWYYSTNPSNYMWNYQP